MALGSNLGESAKKVDPCESTDLLTSKPSTPTVWQITPTLRFKVKVLDILREAEPKQFFIMLWSTYYLLLTQLVSF